MINMTLPGKPFGFFIKSLPPNLKELTLYDCECVDMDFDITTLKLEETCFDKTTVVNKSKILYQHDPSIYNPQTWEISKHL